MTKKIFFYAFITSILIAGGFLLNGKLAKADQEDCAPGYEWQPQSGVGCVQIDCPNVPGAHWGYTSNCVCGSAGSIYENPADANVSCLRGVDYTSCPGCVFACVNNANECPDSTGANEDEDTTGDEDANNEEDTTSNEDEPADTDSDSDESLSTTGATEKTTCKQECQRLYGSKKGAKIIETGGKYPACNCQVDYVDSGGNVIKTINQAGDKVTTYIFDPASGQLLTKNTISKEQERQRIREKLGYKYTEEQIDKLLNDKKMQAWFSEQMQGIKTETRLWHPNFWWQHLVALLDHGFTGSDSDFVDVHQYGRCGDSMIWLENQLAEKLKLSDDTTERQQAMVSITGEKGADHTSLMIRPIGMTNEEWGEIITELNAKSGQGGLTKKDIEAINPALLQARVLDPYFKKVRTVEDFIAGWSTIRIS